MACYTFKKTFSHEKLSCMFMIIILVITNHGIVKIWAKFKTMPCLFNCIPPSTAPMLIHVLENWHTKFGSCVPCQCVCVSEFLRLYTFVWFPWDGFFSPQVSEVRIPQCRLVMRMGFGDKWWEIHLTWKHNTKCIFSHTLQYKES